MPAEELLLLTVPEVHHLLCRLIWKACPTEREILTWSRWRRRHQACASRCHYQRRLQRLAVQVWLSY